MHAQVTIKRPTANSRRLAATIVVDRSIEDVWSILTDYDNLATHVPNLVQSRLVDRPASAAYEAAASPDHPRRRRGVRLFQEGAQKIIGFDFRASVTLDMDELFFLDDDDDDDKSRAAGGGLTVRADRAASAPRAIAFACVESPFFSQFDGEWRLQRRPRRASDPPPATERLGLDGGGTTDGDGCVTELSYDVAIRPRGPVPVLALEWRIREVRRGIISVVGAAAGGGVDLRPPM